MTPDQIYLGSLWDKYYTSLKIYEQFSMYIMTINNEILLDGVDSDGTPVEITGIFIKEEGSNYNKELSESLVDFADKHDLPVVNIPDL